MGVGNFFGLMPKALRSASGLHGVELDPITGGIAKLLYSGAKIQAPMSFADYRIPDNLFRHGGRQSTVRLGGFYDPLRPGLAQFSIHNYFFAKSIDGLRPGEVMAMVVTNRFLDGARDEARRYLAEKADFLGAVRLPNNAFSKNANTEVTTDIVFLRRKVPGEAFIAPQDWNDMTLRERANWVKAAGGGDLPDTDQRLGTDWEKLPSDNQARLLKARAVQNAGHDWLDVVEHTDKNGAKVPLNEYFHEHRR